MNIDRDERNIEELHNALSIIDHCKNFKDKFQDWIFLHRLAPLLNNLQLLKPGRITITFDEVLRVVEMLYGLDIKKNNN